MKPIGIVFYSHSRGFGNCDLLREFTCMEEIRATETQLGTQSSVEGVVILGWKLFADATGDSTLPLYRLN